MTDTTGYVALLRGVNVGGNSIVSMADLRAAVQTLGWDDVKTYINSGNVLFRRTPAPREEIAAAVEAAIQRELGMAISTVVRDTDDIAALVRALPDDWTNDGVYRSNVIFLWPDVDEPGILDRLPSNPEVEELRYVPGAVLQRVARVDANRSRLNRVVGTDIYKRISIRNANTVRKLHLLMQPAG